MGWRDSPGHGASNTEPPSPWGLQSGAAGLVLGSKHSGVLCWALPLRFCRCLAGGALHLWVLLLPPPPPPTALPQGFHDLFIVCPLQAEVTETSLRGSPFWAPVSLGSTHLRVWEGFEGQAPGASPLRFGGGRGSGGGPLGLARIPGRGDWIQKLG